MYDQLPKLEICWCGKHSKSVLLQVLEHLKEVLQILILKFNTSHISLKSQGIRLSKYPSDYSTFMSATTSF